MSNIVKFPNVSSDCFEYILCGGRLNGLFTIDESIEIEVTYDGLVKVKSGEAEMDRKSLAEFLWAAAIFLDSEERYKPEGEIVGLNYD